MGSKKLGTFHMCLLFYRTSADTGFSARWIEGHQLAAAALGKPLVLEEFGKIATGTAANLTRLRDSRVQVGGHETTAYALPACAC